MSTRPIPAFGLDTMQSEAQRHAAAQKRRETAKTNSGNNVPDDALLRLPQVLARVPVGRSTLWGWVRDGRFPKPIKLGPMTTAWRASEISAWLDAAGKEVA